MLGVIKKQNGAPPKGYKGGELFKNGYKNLPQGGNYKEYDVNTRIQGVDRGTERMVIDSSTGKSWYTNDHYYNFTPMN